MPCRDELISPEGTKYVRREKGSNPDLTVAFDAAWRTDDHYWAV